MSQQEFIIIYESLNEEQKNLIEDFLIEFEKQPDSLD